MRRSVLALALLLAAPAFADIAPAGLAQQAAVMAGQLSPAERSAYRQIFQSLRAGDFAAASTALDALPTGLLTPVARAELLVAGPARDPAAVTALLGAAPELPQAVVLARLVPQSVLLPAQHRLVRATGPSKRPASRPARDCAILAAKVQPLFRANDPVAAEPIVEAAVPGLAPEAATEWRQKLAWAYFQAGDDVSARRVAALAQTGAGDWSVDATWVNGLAAWRLHDYAAATGAFDRVASNAGDDETRAAGLFWAARSDAAGGNTDKADLRLQKANRLGETFYGMLAGAALGLPLSPAAFPEPLDNAAVPDRPNLRRATALVEIGETALADQLIRYQARIGPPDEHSALIALAARLGLPATQVWLAQNSPPGARLSLAARFPTPGWSPAQGWRVDPALIYAHALQESEFRSEAVSPAGARGLMQLMPATASLIARHRGDAVRPLDDPAVSFEYGQSYLEELAASGGTGGLLPKVIAAYNAGPNNVARWTGGSDDPLLFIESIPFAQTRAYVAIVLRNYWVYQRQAGVATSSLSALAQGRWPLFPGRATQTASAAVYAPN